MRLSILLALILATGCGQSQNMAYKGAEELKTYDVAEEPPPPEGVQPPGITANSQVASPEPPSAPQIAYTYAFGYTVDPGAVADVQRAHVSLCDRLGAARCRIASLTRDTGDGQFVRAGLSLLVDARIARAFGDRLDAAVAGAGGQVSSRGIEAEDLSKQIVDTEARIRGKQALADRLLVLLQNRQGKVGELVEAERAFAQAQEELDAGRSWLAEMQQRVGMSKVDISYSSTAPAGGGLWRPVRESVAQAGQVLGSSIAALITLTLALLPWVLVLWVLLWALRRLGWARRLRWPWRRRRVSSGAALVTEDRSA